MNKSVSEVGIVEPILLNESNEIVGGQLRWSSALVEGLPSVSFIKMKFKDKFSERIASILQDYHHHPLSDRDKGLFVKRCIEEDNKTVEDVANSLGIDPQTVRNWLKWNKSPEAVENNKKLKQMYFDLPSKKRIAVRSILDRAPFKENDEKAIEVIEFAGSQSLRELEQARKDVIRKTPVDFAKRRERLKHETVLIEIKIPKYLDSAFRKKLKLENKDYTEVLIQKIEEYVRS